MKKLRSLLVLVLMLVLSLVVFTGCSSENSVEENNDEASVQTNEEVEEEIVVDGVLSTDKKFMVGTVENNLKEDYEVKQFAEGNYIVNSYVSNGVTFGEAGTGMTGKVSMLSNTTVEEAKNEILKEDTFSGANVSNRKMNDIDIVCISANNIADEYQYVQVILFEKEGNVFRIDYTIQIGHSNDVGEFLLQEIVTKTELYK